MTIFCYLLGTFLLNGCSQSESLDLTIGHGQMPNLATDESGNPHIVYGTGDSLLYASSVNEGKTFSKPVLIAIVPNLFASHSRGPQIASSQRGLTVIACDKTGNIFSFSKTDAMPWSAPAKVNDADTTAKEGLMALSGDGNILYAIWLDLRHKNNQIFGAGSTDGGRTWSINKLIYASPDSTVCECCKPSVLINGRNINVMFRNWIQGNRDMYLIQSFDLGRTFSAAQKLGTESWPLKGCPMDGGAVAALENGTIHTVWRRKDKIYACEPGKAEKEVGAGKGCTFTTVGNKLAYAWTEDGNIVCTLPNRGKVIVGSGAYPVIKPAGNNGIICVWENDKQIRLKKLRL